MSRPARPEPRPGDAGEAAVPGEPSTRSAGGAGLPPELLRDAQRAAFDLLIFAPIGFAKRARSLLPDLIREGRSTAASARMIGKFVTPIARTQGTKLVKAKVAELTRSTTETRSSNASPSAESAGSRPGGTARATAKVAPKRLTGPNAASSKEPAPKGPSPTGPSGTREPFAGYDHLGSAAVVARLVELTRAERSAVRAYETANRNRRTVLGRLDQLDPSR